MKCVFCDEELEEEDREVCEGCSGPTYTDDEKEEIKDQLKKLGYL